MNQGAGAWVSSLEPGLTKGTWGKKGTQVPRTKIKKYFRRKLPKNINIDKILTKWTILTKNPGFFG